MDLPLAPTPNDNTAGTAQIPELFSIRIWNIFLDYHAPSFLNYYQKMSTRHLHFGSDVYSLYQIYKDKVGSGGIEGALKAAAQGF